MTTRKTCPTITLEQLRGAIAAFPDHYTIDFGGLAFYRIKPRGDEHLQMEFSQQVYLDQETGLVVVENLEPYEPEDQ